jgi:hypothetical protein
MPDVIMACCGDVPTLETLTVSIMREHLPDLKILDTGDRRLDALPPPCRQLKVHLLYPAANRMSVHYCSRI